jgi:quercetin dioxygenase-like cupin family protein
MELNNDAIVIIPRNDIPAIHEIEKEGKKELLGELRDFRWHDTLKKFLPSENNVSFSWVKLKPNETLRPHIHSTESMIICYRGNGEFIGKENKKINEGDVVAVPAFCSHGFTGGNPEGMWALSIQFGPGLYTDPQNARVTFLENNANFESLLAFNQSCIEEFRRCRFLAMLTDGTLDNPKKRQRYIDALQIWSNSNQDLLFARQGTTSNSKFAPIFLQHLFEEVGHDRVHADRQEKFTSCTTLTEDPIIEAVANWFICQMFRRDDIEKAALIHLIIENGSDIYHRIARPVLHATVNDHYFELHEADTEHAKIGLHLLNQLSVAQYKELQPLLDKGWKMIACMTNRICELVDEVN